MPYTINKLTPANYYTDDRHMSVSAFKLYQKCEYAGKIGWDSEPSEAMMIGSYVDAFVEGTLDKFKLENPDIFTARGELRAGYKNADLICDFITKDPVFSQFMSGEKQTIFTGDIAGVPWKVKIDSYSPHIAINDLKVMSTVTDKRGNYYDFITPWGYDIQLAAYQHIVEQNTGEKLPCYICAVTKESPINSVIINIPQHYLDKALYIIEQLAPRYYDIKMGKIEPAACGICDKCIQSRSETPIISLEDIINV